MTSEIEFWKNILKKWSALDPPERISEGLFGLIMVLTFTGTISVSTAGRQEVSELLWAALGCNLAWGIVDAIMYVMDEIVNRAHSFRMLQKLKLSGNDAESAKIIRENISPIISELMEDEEIGRLNKKLQKLPEISVRKSLTYKDLLIAVQIFLIVFLITFPVAMPFIFVDDIALAMRVSNVIALVLLFAGGFALARYSGLRPVLTALTYVAIGVFLVLMTMALGG